jgi:O-acetyl-ADP-ribose deacetylase (regulator of RNase III)
MKIINKDLLTVDSGIICHQVNCQKTMGSGIAKSIRDKWPHVYEVYSKFMANEPDFARLGHALPVPINNDLAVVNIFGQLYYGGDGKRYTDYGALNIAFEIMKTSKREGKVYFPYKFGCDRGGGDWNIVSKMIDYYFPDAIVCKL